VTKVRRPLGGAVGDDPDPTPPEIRRDAALLLDEPDDAELYDFTPYVRPSLRERMGEWRKRLLPLPDEVVHEYLGEDEYVIHTDHPSFRAFLIQNAIQVGILSVALVVFFYFARIEIGWTTLGIFLVVDVVFAILALKRLSERYISYVITNLRLIRVAGIVGRKISSIPWTRMTGIGYRQSAMGRFLGYATIHLESANEESGLREFSDINDPATFHQHLLDMVSAKTGQSSDKGLPPPPTKGVRKSFMQRRRERRASMERAQQFELERERQARDRARENAEARVRRGDDDEDDTDPGLMDDSGGGEPPPRPPRPAPRDRGGAYEGLSTPESNAPDRPAVTPRPPSERPPSGRRPPPKRRTGPPPQSPREGRRQGDQRSIPGDGVVGDSEPGQGAWRPSPEKGRRAAERGRPAPPQKQRRPASKGRSAPRPRTAPRKIAPEVIEVSGHTEEVEVRDERDVRGDDAESGARRPRRFWPGTEGDEAAEPRKPREPRTGPKLPRFGRRPPPSVPPPDAQRRAESAQDEEALGGLSARDALGAVRKSSRQRPPSTAKPTRPRRPSFGRRERPEAPAKPPEPRELPPARDEHTASDPDPGPEAGPDDDTEEL
jgi:PH (Pleckstrin Homology) domain-containing protein